MNTLGLMFVFSQILIIYFIKVLVVKYELAEPKYDGWLVVWWTSILIYAALMLLFGAIWAMYMLGLTL